MTPISEAPPADRLRATLAALAAGQHFGAHQAVNAYVAQLGAGRPFPRKQIQGALPWLSAVDRVGFAQAARLLAGDLVRYVLGPALLDQALAAARAGNDWEPGPFPAREQSWPAYMQAPQDEPTMAHEGQALVLIWQLARQSRLISGGTKPTGDAMARAVREAAEAQLGLATAVSAAGAGVS